MPRTRKSKHRLRLNKPALFEYLGYQPHPGQLEIHLSQAPRRVVACGVRWGKTLCAAFEGIAAALQPGEQSLGWVVAPSFELCDRVFGEIRRVVEKHLDHRIVLIQRAGRRIVLRNMAGGLGEIRGKSAENADSLLGEGLDWLIVDEAARLKDGVWESYLSPRLVDRQGTALVASTPQGGGWFHELFMRAKLDPKFASWNFPSWSNPYLSIEAIEEEIDRLPPDVFGQEYGAEFLDGARRLCGRCKSPEYERGVVLLAEDEELQPCDVCGRPVDREGSALGIVASDGRVHLKTIRLPVQTLEQARESMAAPKEKDGGGAAA